MRRFFPIISAIGVCFAVSVKAADDVPITETGYLLSAFKQICLVHLDDKSGQIAAAKVETWKLGEPRIEQGGAVRFRSDSMALSISESDKVGCSITAAIDPSTDIQAMSSQVTKSFPVGEAKAMPQSDSRYWMVGFPGRKDRFVISVKVSNASGVNLATLNSSKL